MWEIYTFWAFVPVILAWNKNAGTLNISLWSFIIIGVGFLSCIAGGYLSEKIGSAKVAFYSLLISGCCCFFSFIIPSLPIMILVSFLLIWGIAVSPDSPQFSALVAQTAPPEYRGTALTLVTCIGFAITIASLQLINFIIDQTTSPERNKIFIFLGPGPLIGLFFLYRLIKRK
jgi:MFS family permease